MTRSVFTPIPAELPEAERAARLKRQHQAEWGLAVARLGGTEPSPDILQALQRYIDGALSLAELAGLPPPPHAPSAVVEATLRREQFTR
ncbi:hypothetical protein [Hymenobacter crusticola]|uniref:Antitoxin VbhA domain-containing protein n=1 Tax=Hymenobacter crusticola TaxID=1770526 RepID=A0A243W4T1_9BACT|nr:hypothetical protein [Hymenobacter crusticola]OUJ66719.1 hypothetical protein BXP70_29000 [Hymenobacter crusticola]